MRGSEVVLAGLVLVAALLVAGCMKRDPRPVDIYPEDVCALCRMAVSNVRFASEILTADGEAMKFDDIGCLQNYRRIQTARQPERVFYMDYNSSQWLQEEHAVILETGAATPMGSGLVAFADSLQAHTFLNDHPVRGLEE